MLTMGEFAILDRHIKIKNRFQKDLNHKRSELFAVNAQKNALLSYIEELEGAVHRLIQENYDLSTRLESAEIELADSDELITSLSHLKN